MAEPAVKDLKVTRGDDLYGAGRLLRGGVPIDLTGCTFAGQVRATVDDETVIGSFNFTPATQSGDGLGRFAFHLDNTVTAVMTGNAVYDMQFTDAAGSISTFVGGAIMLKKDVTRGA